MIYPFHLDKGYKVGVTATSAGCESEADLGALESSMRHFAELGYPVIVTNNVRSCCKGRSSDGATRAWELAQLFEDKEVRAIFAAHGGDYLVEMLSHMNFNVIRENPKWFQGYSDTTGLTFTITTNLDIATIYSYNFGTFGMEHWHSSLVNNLQILEGHDIIQHSFDLFQDGYRKKITGREEFALEKPVEWKNIYPDFYDQQEEIILNGRAIGGCLDVLLTLIGTRFDKTKEFIEKYKQDGLIWFLESFDLGSEALTRALWQLKEAGWFEHVVGFVFGRPAMYHTETDTAYDEAVLAVLGELNVPIILDTDIGHKPPQFAMINGAIAKIKSKAGKGSIIFERR